MNSIPKVVVSSTLNELKWNNSSLIKGDVRQEIIKMKLLPGKDILVAGSCELVQTLMKYDLIDEYKLMIFPIIRFKGRRLFNSQMKAKNLKLIDTVGFQSGVVVHTYHPMKQ